MNAAIGIAVSISSHEHSGVTKNMKAGLARGRTATSPYTPTDATATMSITM